jgi:hypothetical protein
MSPRRPAAACRSKTRRRRGGIAGGTRGASATRWEVGKAQQGEN